MLVFGPLVAYYCCRDCLCPNPPELREEDAVYIVYNDFNVDSTVPGEAPSRSMVQEEDLPPRFEPPPSYEEP